jgi:hypothetical protein
MRFPITQPAAPDKSVPLQLHDPLEPTRRIQLWADLMDRLEKDDPAKVGDNGPAKAAKWINRAMFWTSVMLCLACNAKNGFLNVKVRAVLIEVSKKDFAVAITQVESRSNTQLLSLVESLEYVVFNILLVTTHAPERTFDEDFQEGLGRFKESLLQVSPPLVQKLMTLCFPWHFPNIWWLRDAYHPELQVASWCEKILEEDVTVDEASSQQMAIDDDFFTKVIRCDTHLRKTS